MIIKICEYCEKEFITKLNSKRFCSVLCQRKRYNRRPEIKEKQRIRVRDYRKNHPEWKERHRILAVTKYRERRRLYWKEYGKRVKVRARIREKEKLRLKTDPQFAIADRLRRSLHHAMTKYSKTGKIMSSEKYGIHWKEIIEHLKPFPENLTDFEIDHIMPLRFFDLSNPEQVKKAFAPENLQWLPMSENRRKGGNYNLLK